VPSRPAGVDFARLRPFLFDALDHQKTKAAALKIARQLDAGRWRAVTHWRVPDPDRNEVDLDSLCYSVEVETADGWAELCEIPWHRLGLEWIDVCAQWEETLRQHAAGTYPDGPNDPGLPMAIRPWPE
jgi:hypothetical protein